MKPPRSHLANAALAAATLYWVVDLSRSGRSAIDWIVLGLVAAAVLYNLVQFVRTRRAAIIRRRGQAEPTPPGSRP